MCGRLNMSVDPADLVDELGVEVVAYEFSPRFNVPPGAALPIIVDRPGETGEVLRRLEAARWGLVPGWAKEEKIGFKAFNARSETVRTKPMFRHAFAGQRCALPVAGYYEWQTDASGKTPWLMRAGDGPQLYMAGLFEFRKQTSEVDVDSADPAVREGWLVTTTILTTAAAGHLSEVHDRMPVMIDAGQITDWISPAADRDHAQSILDGFIASFDPRGVERFQVGSAVGNVRNQSAEVASPVSAQRIR